MKKISYVIPCYKSENTIRSVVDEIDRTMADRSDYTHEIILVNDCSPDKTFEAIRSLAKEHNHITGIDLSKNYGQHAALMAGYARAEGDIIVSLDDDGQTPADEAWKLIAEIEAGRDVVYARYDHKQHSRFRNFGSGLNELMTRIMLGKPKELYISSYFAARRFIVDEMLKYTNSFPYVIGLVLRSTGNISNVDVKHREREIGVSGYNLSKLFALWMSGFTAFSIKPLRIATVSGAVFALLSFLYGTYTIIKKLVNPLAPAGYAALICAVIFMGGMTMLMLGLVGEYVGRTYMSINASPQYVIREVVTKEQGAENR